MESSTAPPDYEVRVTLTLAIPYYGAHPGCFDANERVHRALCTVSKDILPHGTHYHGSITTSVRSATEVKQDAKRAEKRRAARGY